jgi:hypothetical protein
VTKQTDSPRVRAGGLVTIAFLKAQLDAGSDHLGLFEPLVINVINHITTESFTTEDVQVALASMHNVSMPWQVVSTLLKRASKNYLERRDGRYRKIPGKKIPQLDVDAEKARIEASQRRLAEALIVHAETRKVKIQSTDDAIGILFRFLESEQIALLLNGNKIVIDGPVTGDSDRAIVAEFIQGLVLSNHSLLLVLREMLEGLVLYKAAFLPDFDTGNRRFRDTRVVFDSSLVRKALGYEGPEMKNLLMQTVGVFKASGIECIVFDKTLEEIRRILDVYEGKLASTKGCESLKQGPMTRTFLINCYSPSDVREMSALLSRDVTKLGFRILDIPAHIKEYTSDERKLADRLQNPIAPKTDIEPRIIHDIDCITGVLTLRRGHRSVRLEDARAVFASDSSLVIRSSQLWWTEDEKEAGVPPIVHIRALTNLVWLKKPRLCADLKVQELVALCGAALLPRQATWDCFLRHLDSLLLSNRITSDAVAAIVVSSMSDHMLKDIEFEDVDPCDIDAVTLDQVVERVKESYKVENQTNVQSIKEEFETRIAQSERERIAAIGRAEAAEEVERKVAEDARKRIISVRERANKWAHRFVLIAQNVINFILILGACVLIFEHPFQHGWIGYLLGISVVVCIIVEFFGWKNHVSEFLRSIEARFGEVIASWLGADL